MLNHYSSITLINKNYLYRNALLILSNAPLYPGIEKLTVGNIETR